MVFLASTLLLVGCEKETDIDSKSPINENNLQANENLLTTNADPVQSYDFNLQDYFDFETTILNASQVENKYFLEYNALPKTKTNIIIKSDGFETKYYTSYSWISVDENSIITNYIVQFITEEESVQVSLFSPLNFTGLARIYSFDGQLVDELYYEAGILISSSNSSIFTFRHNMTTGSRFPIPCLPDVTSWGTSNEGSGAPTFIIITVTTEHYTDWYKFNNETGEYEFVEIRLDGITISYEQVPCGSSGTNGDGIYLQHYERQQIEIDANEGGDKWDIALNDPCRPEMETDDLAHEIVSKDDQIDNMDEFTETLESEEYYQLDNLINELASQNLSDPCNPDLSTNEILNKIMAEMDICSLQGFIDAFDAVDKIINNFTDNRLKCIYENMLSGSTDDLFCNSFSNFFGESNINLNLQNSIEVQALAQTTSYITSTEYPNQIDIAFNENQISDLCEVTVMALFLHEGIHAEMFRQLGDSNIDPNSVAEIWNTFDLTIDDHENMADAYISDIVNSLKLKFGNRYTDDEYKAVAWIGLGDIYGEGANTSAWDALSATEKQNLTDTFNNINSNCNDDECNN